MVVALIGLAVVGVLLFTFRDEIKSTVSGFTKSQAQRDMELEEKQKFKERGIFGSIPFVLFGEQQNSAKDEALKQLAELEQEQLLINQEAIKNRKKIPVEDTIGQIKKSKNFDFKDGVIVDKKTGQPANTTGLLQSLGTLEVKDEFVAFGGKNSKLNNSPVTNVKRSRSVFR